MEYSEIVDLDNDNEDEIVVPASNFIKIYHIVNHRTGVEESKSSVSSCYLHPNYPNPFNAATSIRYSMEKPGPVLLSIYNIMGQKVATLDQGIKMIGEHKITWDAGDILSGIYFAKLESQGQSQFIKMILLK